MASTMQLEFSQAMTDFTTMFPDMERDVIEAVLRCNNGAVDATIDQLLAMSIDNQNEKLRNEFDVTQTDSAGTSINLIDIDQIEESPNKSKTGALSKIREQTSSSSSTNQSIVTTGSKRWQPPLLAPLPSNFLKISNTDLNRHDFEMPDEQFALMLQNEEFMNELRWNQEFMNTLEKEQQEKGRSDDDTVFKERLRNMGKISRKKFLQIARVFTWQRNKKLPSFRHPDSLPLKEEHSDDEEAKNRK